MRQRASTPCLPQTGGRRSGSQASTPCLPQTGGYSVSIRLLGLSLARFRAFRVQRQCPASGSGVRVRAFASCASQPRCPGGLIGFAHSPPAPDKPGGSSAPPRPYQPRCRGGLISPAAVAALSAPPPWRPCPPRRRGGLVRPAGGASGTRTTPLKLSHVSRQRRVKSTDILAGASSTHLLAGARP